MATWSTILNSVYDTTPNLRYRSQVIRNPIVQKTYNNFVKQIPLNGLSTNRFPYDTAPGIHNYIFWSNDWDLPEEVIIPLFPETVEVVSYVNPPERRSMINNPHRNIFIRGFFGIPPIEHSFDNTVHIENLKVYFWNSETLDILWQSSVFDRWRSYRNPKLDRLIVLFYYGGYTAKIQNYQLTTNKYIASIISTSNNLLESDLIGTTICNPILFDYLQYLTCQSDPNRILSLCTRNSRGFQDQLSSWETNQWLIPSINY